MGSMPEEGSNPVCQLCLVPWPHLSHLPDNCLCPPSALGTCRCHDLLEPGSQPWHPAPGGALTMFDYHSRLPTVIED